MMGLVTPNAGNLAQILNLTVILNPEKMTLRCCAALYHQIISRKLFGSSIKISDFLQAIKFKAKSLMRSLVQHQNGKRGVIK